MEEAPPTIETEAEVAAEPTRSVGTFWDRLDQVLELNLESARMRERVEELLEEFPGQSPFSKTAQSFIFQPERVTVCTNDATNPNIPTSISFTGVAPNANAVQDQILPFETYSTFRLNFKKMLRNVKSIQLISAAIPQAVIQIPDNQLTFYYYRLTTLAASSVLYNPAGVYQKGQTVYTPGAPNTYWASRINNNFTNPLVAPQNWVNCGTNGARPNYFQMTNFAVWFANLQFVSIAPSYSQPEKVPPADYNLINRQFQDYQDLVDTMNACANDPGQALTPGDVSFSYNPTLNRVQFKGTNTATYFYIPIGYGDPNIDIVQADMSPFARTQSQYTLNLRLGFTWNGLLPDPFSVNPYAGSGATLSPYAAAVSYFLRPQDPGAGLSAYNLPILTANSYPDLVYSSVCRIYADFVLGSSEDSQSQGGLLCSVPINATTLGIAYYQSAFNLPLTKVPDNLTEVTFRLVTDAGAPYILPNSAAVTLELAVSYK